MSDAATLAALSMENLTVANEHLKPRETILNVGDIAPDFTLPDQNRADWRLSDALKKGPVVLSFYPMSFTGVCGTEMKCISAEKNKWEGKGQVVGISCDSFAVQKAWSDAEGLKQPLLADMHRAVCKAYGLYLPDLNIAWRGTVIVGQDGKVTWSQKREIKNAMNFDEVLVALA